MTKLIQKKPYFMFVISLSQAQKKGQEGEEIICMRACGFNQHKLNYI